MHKIDTARAVDGAFVPGNPGLGQRPTGLDHHWCNAIQDEIANVITAEAGGDTDLVKGANTQLLAALQVMIDRAMGATAVHVTQIGETKEFLVAGAWDTDYYEELAGQTRNRADYAALWALVSASSNLAADATDKTNHRTKWGLGDGVDTFEFPDIRGMFRRVSKGVLVSAIIPDDGEFKASQNKSHRHDLPADIAGGMEVQALFNSDNNDENTTGQFTGYEGGDEACPDHTTVYYVIRVR